MREFECKQDRVAKARRQIAPGAPGINMLLTNPAHTMPTVITATRAMVISNACSGV